MSIFNKPDGKIFASNAKSGEVEAFPDVLRGWGLTLDQTDGKPPMAWMNGLFKRTDECVEYLRQNGVAAWDAELEYPKNAITNREGALFISLRDNIKKDPQSNNESWRKVVDIATQEDIAAGTAGKMVDAAGLFNYTPKGIGASLFVDLPETKAHEAIFVIDRSELYTWSESQFFTGYRSPKVGMLEDEGTGYLRPWQTGAYGALFRKDDPNLIRLWAWAQENNMVLPAANWAARMFKFADVDEEYFRVPDLSNVFKRYTGTNYDNNESREVGTYQGQQLVHHAHHYNQLNYTDQVGWWGQPKRIPTNYTYEQTSGTGGSETRPENVAFHPRIHL